MVLEQVQVGFQHYHDRIECPTPCNQAHAIILFDVAQSSKHLDDPNLVRPLMLAAGLLLNDLNSHVNSISAARRTSLVGRPESHKLFVLIISLLQGGSW